MSASLLDKIGATSEEVAAACALSGLDANRARKGDLVAAVELLRESRAAEAQKAERKAERDRRKAAKADKERRETVLRQRDAWAAGVAAQRRDQIRSLDDVGKHPTMSRGEFAERFLALMVAAAREKVAKHAADAEVAVALGRGAGRVQSVSLYYGMGEHHTVEVLAACVNLGNGKTGRDKQDMLVWIDAEDVYLETDEKRWYTLAVRCVSWYGLRHQLTVVPAVTSQGATWVIHHRQALRVGPLGETVVPAERLARARQGKHDAVKVAAAIGLNAGA